MQETIKTLREETATFVVDPANPNKYNELKDANFEKFCDAAAKHLTGVPKLPKKSIAVMGGSGQGKSTIINALAGKGVTKVGLSETTDAISLVYSEGPYDFYDVPGAHEARNDFNRIDNLMKIKQVHMVLLVYMQRVDHTAQVARLLMKLGIPFIGVRNQCEISAETEKEWQVAYDAEMEKWLMYCNNQKFPLVYIGKSKDTANGGHLQHLDRLEKTIQDCMASLPDEVVSPPKPKKSRVQD